MNIDSTITLPLVIAFSAIIAPTITALITSAYKLKELEQQAKSDIEKIEKQANLEYQREDKLHRRDILENYLKYANAIESSESDYKKAYLPALAIVPKEAKIHMQIFDVTYVQQKYVDYMKLSEVSDIIEKELNSLL